MLYYCTLMEKKKITYLLDVKSQTRVHECSTKGPRFDESFYNDQHSLVETHLDAVRGTIELKGFYPSASTSGARRSAATSDKDKQICFMLMPRT